ncbi:SDR family NAD(P)-dependent oxidoreductase [Risungbinella massiliensis]|uniref:SDR family NAD(P)-dependent oxidoreductase n=1 Tax=Risungbinella massiliensis TaxID=1329796 RepID=UPI0005CBC9BA|nr:SDR family oxidoreductase [Risungbinella massiliensis]
MKNYIIFGASKGLGDAFVKGLPDQGDQVWIVSRTQPDSLQIKDGVHRSWIEADLSKRSSNQKIADAIQEQRMDVLIYNAGIWEKEGYTEHYDFEKDESDHIVDIMNVNLTSAITCIQRLLPNLRKSSNAKIVLIGSTDGLENAESTQVAYTASKFGIRGVGNALREHVRKDGIGVTCINPGNIAAMIPYEEGIEKAISRYNGTRIPVQDIVSLIRCVIELSPVSCVKEINVPAMKDTFA